MSDPRSRLQWDTGFPWPSLFEGHPPSYIAPNRPVQYRPGSQGYEHSQGWLQRAAYPDIRLPQLPLVRELGFRLGLHDIPAACMSMMSFAMERGQGEEEEEGEGEGEGEDGYGGEGEDEDDCARQFMDVYQHQFVHEDRDERTAHRVDQHVGEYEYRDGFAHERAGQFEGGRTGDYEDRHIGSAGGFEHEAERAGERMAGYEVEDADEGVGDPEEGLRHGRRKKPRKPRRPYSVTCALRKTNWFESSMEWEDEHFRVIYRLVDHSQFNKYTGLTIFAL
jgi:hypothetical protein